MQELDSLIFSSLQKMGVEAQKNYGVRKSDRPDISDFQCNAAMLLAKVLRKKPLDVASDIIAGIPPNDIVEKIFIAGPGFINIILKDAFISLKTDQTADDPLKGLVKNVDPKTVVIDFGAPNVAKEMHVGHLRSAIIGESLKRIHRIMGDKVIGDNHLGDWGTPMGMIISEYYRHHTDADIDKLTLSELNELYKNASARCKANEEDRREARIITDKLQSGDPAYTKLWQHFRALSVADIKEIYDYLDVHFDLWYGESTAHPDMLEMLPDLKAKGFAKIDDGALIIDIKENEDDQMPPIILEKSDGGVTYGASDLATLVMRNRDYDHPATLLYCVDKRQSLHLEQVRRAAVKTGILKPDQRFIHVAFGTVNGMDGKPFKTRDGGVMRLRDMIDMAVAKVSELLPKDSDVADIGVLKRQIAVASLKFQDLKNPTATDYIFNLDDFAKFEGKTGPYMQYSIARINSIMRKASIPLQKISIAAKAERDLALLALEYGAAVKRAYNEEEPSTVADYAFTLAQTFSTFYGAVQVISDDVTASGSRLKLIALVRDILTSCLDLLGIEAPEVMLKG